MTTPPVDESPYRHTPWFTEATVPAGLLRDHATRAGSWGRLEVASGRLRFTWADTGDVVMVEAGEHLWIPPGRRHAVALEGPVRFRVAFVRAADP